MTMRDAVPRFGMRAAVAVVALAALLAVGSPASAQVAGGEIWNETMTVGDFPIGHGYSLSDGIGSLSDDTFSTGPNLNSVTLILDSPIPNKRLQMGLSAKLNDNELKSMSLYLGSQLFAFEDADYLAGSIYGHVYIWPHDPNFGWTTGQTVAVKILASPVITIEAVTTQVEYGGNGNAAASTAEFRFTRYGSTENELSFRVRNGGLFGSDTATLKFDAGQSSFSNFHWAVDVDHNGGPLCAILWQVLAGSNFLLGTPISATVTVEGPGTTCMGGM